MRIAVNGWFHDQLATGSGQYLDALAEFLPRIVSGHEIIMLRRRGEERRSGGAEAPGREGEREQGSGGEAQYGIPQGRFAVRNTQYATRIIQASTPFDRLNTNLAKLWFEQVTFPRACRACAPMWRLCRIGVRRGGSRVRWLSPCMI